MAPRTVTIDLTQDDNDAVSAAGQAPIAAIIKAKADAKVKEAQQRQELRDADRRKRKLQTLEALKSGKDRDLIILSDEEPTPSSSSRPQGNRVKSTSLRRDTPKKTTTEASSILAASPVPKLESKRVDAGHHSRNSAKLQPVPSESSSTLHTTQQRGEEHYSERSFSARRTVDELRSGPASTHSAPSRVSAAADNVPMPGRIKDGSNLVGPTRQEAPPSARKSPYPAALPSGHGRLRSLADNDNISVNSDAANAGNPVDASRQRSPMPRHLPRNSHNIPPTYEHSKPQGENSPTPDYARFLTSRTVADRSTLPTPALTPSSLADNADDTEKSTEDSEILRLHTDDIERVLRRHQDALREHQEDLVKHSIRNATDIHQSFAGPERKIAAVNPFKGLFSKKGNGTSALGGEKQHQIVMQVSRVPSKAGSKPTSMSLQMSGYSTNAQEVPKVKSIGRLGASRDLLARNAEILTHMPWFSDNETNDDLQEGEKRYLDVRQEYEDDIKIRLVQRRCRAMSTMWKPQVMKLLAELGVEVDDVLYYLLHEDAEERPAPGTLSAEMDYVWFYRADTCGSCVKKLYDKECVGPEGKRISHLIKRPRTERRLAMAGLLCAEFIKVASINLWHVVSETIAAKKLQQIYLEQLEGNDSQSNILETFCYACCQFKCVTHGAYVNTDDVVSNQSSIDDEPASSPAGDDKDTSSDKKNISEAGPQKEVVLDDPEIGINTRIYASLPLRKKVSGQHRCGVFCLSLDIPVTAMLGRRPNGAVSGVSRLEMQDTEEPTFNDSAICDSKTCFWDRGIRNQEHFEILCRDDTKLRSLFGDKLDLFQTLLPMELSSKRGPCELALVFPQVTCLEIFYVMLCSFRAVPHPELQRSDITTTAPEIDVDLSNDKTLEHRNFFVPCSHMGPCQPGTCSCADNKVSCEPSCGCSRQCIRRFKGCTCRDQRRKVCFEDSRCECFASNRECYPELCAGCGVQEILDPVNKRRQDLDFRCRNNRIQLGIPKRTIMGVSEVHGWGLFAGETIAKSEFISEYKGELISIEEGNRRGGVYHNLGLEYLFKLSKDQELDGSRVSNKARFINNSSLTKNINVLPKLLLCNGVSRIMLYAARDIAAGEELFYEYGYHKLKRANFKEKPETSRRLVQPTLFTKSASLGTPSLEASRAPSLHSEPDLFVSPTDDDPDELDDQPTLPTSELDSEFDIPNEASEDVSSDSEDNESGPHLRFMPKPSLLRGPAPRSSSSTNVPHHEDLFSSLSHSPNNRAKKKPRLSLSQPKSLQKADTNSFTNSPSRRKDEPDLSSATEDIRLTSIGYSESERKRKISQNDKRFGGASQRKAAETRRKKAAAEQQLLGLLVVDTSTGLKRKRDDKITSSPMQESSSSQQVGKMRLKLTRPKQLATRLSLSPSPERQLSENDIDVEQTTSDRGRHSSTRDKRNAGVTAPKGGFHSNTSSHARPSGFSLQSTRLISQDAPLSAQQGKSPTSKPAKDKHLLGYAPR